MEHTALVLEGGGMRGVYTAGVLDFFMEKDLFLPYVIGVSAGACHACSYVSRQTGRSRRVTVDYSTDGRYLSYKNLIKKRSLFGMDFIFDTIPNQLDPFDYKSFEESKQKLVVGTTDCISGEAVYFDKDNYQDFLKVVRASSSLPFVSSMVEIDGKPLMDGGIIDPIPIKKALNDGNERSIIVLTRNPGYRKKPFKMKQLAKGMYRNYDGLVKAMTERHQVYNETLQYIEALQEEGKVFVIQPVAPLTVGRVEKDQNKLNKLYHQGYQEAKEMYPQLIQWLRKC